jgi:hypothetical protein
MRWQLPPLVQDSLGLFNSYRPQPLTVMLGCALARASARDWHNRELADYLELLAEFLGISQDEAQALIHQFAAQAGRELYQLPLPLSVHRLLPITPKRKPSSKVQDGLKVKPANGTSPPQVAAPPSDPLSAQSAPPKVAPKADNPANPLQIQLTDTVDTMQHDHGLNNVMFAMLSPDRRCLKARFVASALHYERLRGFEAKLDEPGLFSIIMQKPQALWLNADNRGKYLPLIPPQTIQSLCDKGFLIMSVFFRNKPIGLFYADNAETEHNLTTDQFNNFKVSCQRFVQGLG